MGQCAILLILYSQLPCNLQNALIIHRSSCHLKLAADHTIWKTLLLEVGGQENDGNGGGAEDTEGVKGALK